MLIRSKVSTLVPELPDPRAFRAVPSESTRGAVVEFCPILLPVAVAAAVALVIMFIVGMGVG
jgi:hypothetical protein